MRIPWLQSARWLVPSVVGGCAGGLVGGGLEAVGYGPVEAVTTVGFAALVVVPALVVVGVIARLLALAWPVAVDDGGGAPDLAAWIAVVWLGVLGLAAAMFQGTWIVASWTQFKPLVVGIAEPAIAIAAGLAVIAVSRPLARLIAAGVRAMDARWQRWRHAWIAAIVIGGAVAVTGIALADVALASACVIAGGLIAWRAATGSLVTPLRVAVATAVLVAVTADRVWEWIVQPKLVGAVDFDVLVVPCAALATSAIVHVVWARLPRHRKRAAIALTVTATAVVIAAMIIVFARPDVALRLWGDRSFAGRTLARLFSADSLHDRFDLDPPVERAAQHPDVVVITLDGVRADRSITMPTLRALGERGAVFEWAFAPSNGPRRSLAAIATALAANRADDPRRIDLVERFHAAGYDTAVFASSGDIPARGCDRYITQRASLVDRLASLFASPRGRPRFAWIDLVDARDTAPYDKALATADALLARILASLPPAIVIVTSAYGLGLGEHGHSGYNVGLYDAVTHVPLVIAGPGVTPGKIADTVSLLDLVPTVIELAGFEPPDNPGLDGRSLAGLIAGARTPDPRAGVALLADDRSLGVVVGRYKLIQQGNAVEVYDTRADPDERANIHNFQIVPMEELRRRIRGMTDRERVSPLN